MTRVPHIAGLALVPALLLGVGCGAGGEIGREEADTFTLAVEDAVDDITAASEDAQRILNEVTSGSDPEDAAAQLDELADDVEGIADGLDDLEAPNSATVVFYDLRSTAHNVSLDLGAIATDLGIAVQFDDPAEAADVARDGSFLLLSTTSATTALSRAVRNLVDLVAA